MHVLIKHIAKNIGISLLLISFIFINFNANSEQSAEEIIKERKALFSKNYKTAKKVQSLSSSGDFDQAKELMTQMMIIFQPNFDLKGHPVEIDR